MILNPNAYKYTLDQLVATIKLGALEEPKYQTLTLLSLGSHVPFAAVLAYALRPDVAGPLAPIEALLASTVAFYHYESVAPWTDLLK